MSCVFNILYLFMYLNNVSGYKACVVVNKLDLPWPLGGYTDMHDEIVCGVTKWSESASGNKECVENQYIYCIVSF